MEAARYNKRVEGRADVKLKVTNKTLPGILLIVIGIVIIIIAIMMFAAFGLPKDVSQRPKELAGPITVAIGSSTCIVGIVLTLKWRKQQRHVAHTRRAPPLKHVPEHSFKSTMLSSRLPSTMTPVSSY